MGFGLPPKHILAGGGGCCPTGPQHTLIFLHLATETKAVHLPHPSIAAAKDIYGEENSSDKGL